MLSYKLRMNGIPVQYQVTGEGEPVILVHGLAASSRWWVRNVSALARHFRVYLIDLPGFGAMRHAHQHFALSRMADWLCAWMEALDIPSAHLIGHSMGGYICLWLAAERPELVQRLVLVSPAIFSEPSAPFTYIRPLLAGARYMPIEFFPTLLYDTARMEPRTFFRATRALLAADLQQRAREVPAPTLLIWGEHDTLVPPAIGTLLRQQIAHSQLVVLKHAGHVAMFDQAEVFNARVITFLRGQPVEG